MLDRPNPITLTLFLIVYLMLVFSVEAVNQFFLLVLTATALMSVVRIDVRSLYLRIRPLILYVPVMLVIYTGSSLLLTSDSPAEVAEAAFLSGIRIFLMVVVTATVIEAVSSIRLLDALRTICRRTALRGRVVEDTFQLMNLTFRFYPMLKEEVVAITNLETYMGLSSDNGRISRVKRMATHLPSLISNCLHRAENLGIAMESRRYGTVLPRGIANPVGFGMSDLLYLLLTALLVQGHFSLA